jgi:predicted P-loop ATPase
MSRDGLHELVDAVAGDDPYHPCLEWIKATPWDGTSRRDLLHQSFELTDQSKFGMARALIDAWMLQGIGALREPDGISAQGVLVLAGRQDLGKTRKVASLCPVPGAVITGAHLDPTDKDHIMQATSGWITELGELDTTTRRADIGALKAFITRNTDIVRPAYARRENTYRRRTVFVGTVNGTGFLRDDTGNRRFWVLELRACSLIDADVMQQVWAEYLHMYDQGERWHLDADTKAALAESNTDHTAADQLRELIAGYYDWDSVDWSAVRIADRTTWHSIEWVTASAICKLIHMDGQHHATRASSIVRDLQNRVPADRVPLPLDTLSRKSNGVKLLAVPRMRARVE